jgi:flagellar hook-basal body complex protein FliE
MSIDPLRLAGMDAASAAAKAAEARAAGSQAAGEVTNADGKSFSDLLTDYSKEVDQAQHNFDDAIKAVENGDSDDLHRVLLAQNQAQLSLRLAGEVRNRLVDAYREVMRSQF